MTERRNPFQVLVPPDGAPPSSPVPTLVLPGGERLPIDGTIVLGRNPQVIGTDARLIALDGASAKVSRTHVRLRLQGEDVIVDDLGSRNGTGLTVPGSSRRRIAPGESAAVPLGSVIDFEPGLTVTIDP